MLKAEVNLTPEMEDQLNELAALRGTEPDVLLPVLAFFGVKNALCEQLMEARCKASAAETFHKEKAPPPPIDWGAVDRPTPPPYPPIEWPAPSASGRREEMNRS